MDFIKGYCDMIIQTAQELKEGKRDLSDSIKCFEMFTNNLKYFEK